MKRNAHRLDDLRGARGRVARSGQLHQQRELVAAEAARQIARSDAALHFLGDRAQHLIADQMAAVIVDLFEAVEIDEQQPEHGAGQALFVERLQEL